MLRGQEYRTKSRLLCTVIGSEWRRIDSQARSVGYIQRGNQHGNAHSKEGVSLSKPVQVLINGEPPSGLEDTFGRLIDGDDNGQPGGDAVAVLRGKGVTLG